LPGLSGEEVAKLSFDVNAFFGPTTKIDLSRQ
jgi:hypothetical protein